MSRPGMRQDLSPGCRTNYNQAGSVTGLAAPGRGTASWLPCTGSGPDSRWGRGVEDVLLRALTPLHLIILLVIALLVFGPRRLPELGGAIGNTLKEFRKGISEAHAENQAQAQSQAAHGVQSGQRPQ